MNQNFSKSKILSRIISVGAFSMGGENFCGYNFFGGGGGLKILDLSKVYISNNYHVSNILDWG